VDYSIALDAVQKATGGNLKNGFLMRRMGSSINNITTQIKMLMFRPSHSNSKTRIKN
jgi:hypothetical protein